MRLSPADVVRLGLLGPRTRKARAALSALGIAIGIATMIVVTGIPASSGRALDARLAALGTNLLRVQPVAEGDKPAPLPTEAVGMVTRIGPVTRVSAVANVHAIVRRSDLVDEHDGSGLTVLAGRTDLLPAVGGRLLAGRFLTDATERFPVAVLGAAAAARLGYDRLPAGAPAPLVSIGNRWFSVTGILAPVPLAADLDQSVIVGWDAARRLLGFDGHPTVLYVRSAESAVEDVRAVLPATVNPRLPGLVQVSRPSDALAAKRAAANAFGALVLGLAGVSLLVGGVGVANTMVISVLERRREIGLRRGLGAHRGQIRLQFLAESVALSTLGGVAGTALGVTAVFAYATGQSWPVAIPPWSAAGGLGGAVLVGAVAGVYPAIRAARLTPVEALAAQ
ncbi:ABC transporter permease [Actinoplanes subtropicus]|uniref:ABC transporter permease n=1 Tax=Actinoplanes subtropicus TaxID=543632 RepID=UPI0004C314EB|nr:ABC transporter permease [Actinoplanes subtropicus]